MRDNQCRTKADCRGQSACVCGRCQNDTPCPQGRPAHCADRCRLGFVCDCGQCVPSSALGRDGGDNTDGSPPGDVPKDPSAGERGGLVLAVAFLEAQSAAIANIRAVIQAGDKTTELSLDKEGGELWDNPRWRSLPLSLPAGMGLRITLRAFDQRKRVLSAYVLSGIRLKPGKTAALISVMRLAPPVGFPAEINRAPRIAGLFLSSTTVRPGERIQSRVIAQDSTNDIVEVRWESKDGVSFLAPDKSETAWSLPRGFQGTRATFSLRISDQRTGRAGLSVKLPVAESPNSPFSFDVLPHIDRLVRRRVSIEPGGQAELSVEALTSGPRARLRYRWGLSSGCGGQLLGGGAAVSWKADASGLSARCQVTVEVADGSLTQRSAVELRPARRAWWRYSSAFSFNEISEVVVGPGGELYVRGHFHSRIEWGDWILNARPQTTESYVARIDAQGNLLWLWQTRSEGKHQLNGMAVGAKGALVLVGSFEGTLTLGDKTLTSRGDRDIVLFGLSAEGQVQRVLQAGGPGRDEGKAIALDAAGAIYVGGGYAADAVFQTKAMNNPIKPTHRNRTDIFVAKLDRLEAGGRWLWVRGAGASFSFAYEATTHLAFAGSGHLVAVGVFGGSASFGSWQVKTQARQSMFVARLSTDGVWKDVTAVDGEGVITPSDVALKGERLAIVGQFTEKLKAGAVSLQANRDAGNSNLFLVELRLGGTWRWGVSIVDVYKTTGNSVVIGPKGNLYVCGETIDSAAFWKGRLEPNDRKVAFLASLTADGKWRWSKPALELRPIVKKLQFWSLGVLPGGDLLLGGGTIGGFVLDKETYATGGKSSFLLRFVPP